MGRTNCKKIMTAKHMKYLIQTYSQLATIFIPVLTK